MEEERADLIAPWVGKWMDVEYCPGCSERRPIEEFTDSEITYDPMDIPVVCRRCREQGPPEKDKFGALTPSHRRSLQALAEGAGLADAARAGGFAKKTLEDLISGRNVPAFRRAFQMMLEEAGLDSTSIIRTYKHTIRAQKWQWNPKEQEFQAFPDNNVRLRTAQQLSKHHQLEYPKELPDGGGQTVKVVIRTNLDGKAPEAAGGVMRAVSSKVSEDGTTLAIDVGEKS